MRVFVADANLDMTFKERMLPSTHVSGGVRHGALVRSRFPKRWFPRFGPGHFPLQGLQGRGKGTGHCREADEACTGAGDACAVSDDACTGADDACGRADDACEETEDA
ncbi:unnamed protein product [Ixodes pacificus]